MKLELKRIQLHFKLSEETPAYTANLYINGVLTAHLSNSGHGGGDNIHLKNPKYTELFYTRILAHYKTLLAFETWCHGLVWDDYSKKQLKKLLNKKIVGMIEDSVYYIKAPGKTLQEVQDYYPEYTILNLLPFDKAWELYHV